MYELRFVRGVYDSCELVYDWKKIRDNYASLLKVSRRLAFGVSLA